MSELAPAVRAREVEDLVTVDANSKGHRPDGKFLSNYETEQINANQDLIREGLDEHDQDTKDAVVQESKHARTRTKVYVGKDGREFSSPKDIEEVSKLKTAKITKAFTYGGSDINGAKKGDEVVQYIDKNGDFNIVTKEKAEQIGIFPEAGEDQDTGELIEKDKLSGNREEIKMVSPVTADENIETEGKATAKQELLDKISGEYKEQAAELGVLDVNNTEDRESIKVRIDHIRELLKIMEETETVVENKYESNSGDEVAQDSTESFEAGKRQIDVIAKLRKAAWKAFNLPVIKGMDLLKGMGSALTRANEKLSNSKKAKVAIGAGALAILGTGLALVAESKFSGSGQVIAEATSDPNIADTANQLLSPEVADYVYQVNPGDGVTHMIGNIAESIGVTDLQPQELYEIAQAHGSDFLSEGLTVPMDAPYAEGIGGFPNPGELVSAEQHPSLFQAIIDEIKQKAASR